MTVRQRCEVAHFRSPAKTHENGVQTLQRLGLLHSLPLREIAAQSWRQSINSSGTALSVPRAWKRNEPDRADGNNDHVRSSVRADWTNGLILSASAGVAGL
jgi:hypothetical protein